MELNRLFEIWNISKPFVRVIAEPDIWLKMFLTSRNKTLWEVLSNQKKEKRQEKMKNYMGS